MIDRNLSLRSAFALFFMVFSAPAALAADSAVERNSNVVGMTPAGHYRGIPAMQDNEPSCAINPILQRNIVCAWNGSGGSDDLIGDTWLRFSESIDGGRTFFNRYLNGSNLNPATSAGQQFGADPVMMCWPGGCGTVMLASTRGEGGGVGGGIYMQMMADFNTESGFRKGFKVNLDQIYRSTGSHFADKPHAIYILDENNPGVVNVSMTVEKPGGGTELISREWPRARIVVVFALFNPSKTDIEILSTHTDNYGLDWSNPKQVAVTSGRDQGVSLAAIGDTVFYGFRRFAEGSDANAMMGVVATRRGTRVSKPFEVAPPICAYDAPTLPSATNNTAAAARTNDFPWVSQNGSNFIMVYSERRRSSDGGCLTILNEPSDSRIMAIVGSSNGKNWSDPVEIAPNAAHGYQFMPTVECSLGVCQIAWWDTRRDSLRTRNFLQGGTNAQRAALTAFENLPLFADFQYATGNGNEVIQFKRTVDMFTKKFEIAGGELVMTPDEPVQASRYQLGLFNGLVIEREVNPAHVKAYKSNTVPFTGDYNSLTSVKHRFVFDPDNPSEPPFWQENASPNLLNLNEDPLFWLAWTDGRNMRGQLYTSAIDGRPPYTRTPAATMVVANGASDEGITSGNSVNKTLGAESVEDSNPGAATCSATGPIPGGVFFPVLNNRTKDADIYGALIENRVNAWSLNPTKTLGNIQRTYTIVAENEDSVARSFRFEIANQPLGFPTTARASWDQLPFDPNATDFSTTAPDEIETEDVGSNSSVSVALFVVSVDPVNPVGIRIYDDTTNELINVLTVNGSIESGPLLNPDGSLNNFELHNPIVYAPDQFNPDQYNPDQYNPDQFNPDLYNPDQFNPDQFNPDQFNPDQYNPDQYNPDQFNPDQFNPDQFNPDQFNPDQYNPDQFNTNLTDSNTLHNSEIPQPDPVVDEDGEPVDLVVKLDVNFGIENDGNTLTPYSVDFALADDEVLAMIANGEMSVQLIAWQDKQISDVQFCEPALITENRVIAAVNNPDLTQLSIPDIRNNRVGALTYFIAPGDILQNTLRFIGPRSKIDILAAALPNDIISYVFASQAANTDRFDLGINREQVVNDRTPARFNFLDNQTSVFEATSSGGALLPLTWVTATKDTEVITPICSPALGSTVGLDIGGIPTPLSCTATSTSNNVTAQLDMFISVVDTLAPTIDLGSVQSDMLVEANVANGAIINYSMPTATDANLVDTNVAVACLPASGSTFPFTAPQKSTTVTCRATDESGNPSTPESFTITVRDTTAPTIDADSVPDNIVKEATEAGGAVATFTVPTATDFDVVDTDVEVTCSATSGSLFPLAAPGPITTVSCTAKDDSGNESAVETFTVTIQDTVAPTISTASMPDDIIVEATGPTGAIATFNLPTAIDADSVDSNLDVSCSSISGSVFPFSPPSQTTTVTCTATDDNGNTSTPEPFTVTVQDTSPPVIDPFTVPANIVVETTQVDGAFVSYNVPVAADINAVDSAVEVLCGPASGSFFNYTAPYPTKTAVTCTATDDSLNSSVTQFDVTVQDTSAPVLDNISPPIFDSSEPFLLEPGKNTFRLVWGPFGATDPDPNLVVECSVGKLDLSEPLYTFFYEFGVGDTFVTCTATDSNGNTASGSFTVTILDRTAPTITLVGDAEITVTTASGPYVDPGATATDNGDVDVTASITIDSSQVDTTTAGTYTVYITATDASGNSAQVTRTVFVEYAYPGASGILPSKTVVKVGSSDPLLWAWLDENGNALDTSTDVQHLSIRNCDTGTVVLQIAGDPGSSGFRFKANNFWQFNWETSGTKGERYCAAVQSGLTGQTQYSPPIRLR